MVTDFFRRFVLQFRIRLPRLPFYMAGTGNILSWSLLSLHFSVGSFESTVNRVVHRRAASARALPLVHPTSSSSMALGWEPRDRYTTATAVLPDDRFSVERATLSHVFQTFALGSSMCPPNNHYNNIIPSLLLSLLCSHRNPPRP